MLTDIDSLKKVNSDFPYSQKRVRKQYLQQSIIESLPEMVEEEKEEVILSANFQPTLQRASRFSVMRDLNEFGNRESTSGKRPRSMDGIKRKKLFPFHNKYHHIIQSQYVSETEEELYSDEDDVQYNKKSKKQIFSLGYLSKLMNKNIYSDHFDLSQESQYLKQKKKFKTGSVMECPISEDVESEH